MTTNRPTSAPSTAKPHSGWPYEPSAETQKSATRERKSSLSAHGVGELRYSGNRFRNGLNVKYVHGVRTTESSSGGASTSRTRTPMNVSTAAPG